MEKIWELLNQWWKEGEEHTEKDSPKKEAILHDNEHHPST